MAYLGTILRVRNASRTCMNMIATGQRAIMVRTPIKEFIHMAAPVDETYRPEKETLCKSFSNLKIKLCIKIIAQSVLTSAKLKLPFDQRTIERMVKTNFNSANW